MAPAPDRDPLTSDRCRRSVAIVRQLNFGQFSEATHRRLKWFWAANFPPVILLYVLVSDELFAKLMLLYLALVSIWACVGTHAAGEDAAAAKTAAEAD